MAHTEKDLAERIKAEVLADRKPESKPVKEPEKADPYKAIVEKYERRAK